MTFMFPRAIFTLLMLVPLTMVLVVLLMGHKESEPLYGVRRTVIRWAYKVASFLILFFCMFIFTSYKHLTEEDVNFYQEWLGPK